MAKNIERYMKQFNLDRNQLAEITDSSYFTVTAWLKARTYPRIDKIEQMAKYFKISKSDLVEENSVETSDTLTKISEVSSKLEEPRQQIVLENAQAQYDEQESSKIIDIRLTKDWLYGQVSHAIADDGIPLTEEQKQFYMKQHKKTTQTLDSAGGLNRISISYCFYYTYFIIFPKEWSTNMWIEEQRNGRFKFCEQYVDNLTNKKKKVTTITSDKNTRETRSQAQKVLLSKISKK